jgi:bacterioferritin (cytochrome b1)
MESNVQDLLADLIELDFDAATAYQAAIEQVQDPSYRSALSEFRIDHLRHIDELGEILRAMGVNPPEQGA